eukprot:1175549-Prorocentrum_minimum.AAC.2
MVDHIPRAGWVPSPLVCGIAFIVPPACRYVSRQVNSMVDHIPRAGWVPSPLACGIAFIVPPACRYV